MGGFLAYPTVLTPEHASRWQLRPFPQLPKPCNMLSSLLHISAVSIQFQIAIAFLPCAVMSLVSDSNACSDAFDGNDTLQQWPQCHRIDASQSRIMQDGFASLLTGWLRRIDRADRLTCIHRMGHLSNFLLDILSVMGVRGMTFGNARMHSLIAYFVDYVRIDPQIDVDGMLENRRRSLAGFRMAGKYLAIIQPFSALLANPKFRPERSMHAYMQPSLGLVHEWESRLGMDDIALVVRSCIIA